MADRDAFLGRDGQQALAHPYDAKGERRHFRDLPRSVADLKMIQQYVTERGTTKKKKKKKKKKRGSTEAGAENWHSKRCEALCREVENWRPLSGAIKGDGQSLVLENVKGGKGGGEATIALDARQTLQGTSMNARLQLTNVDGSALRYRGLAMPQGQTSLQMSLASQARSAAGLSGALSGAGTVTLKDARIAGLDPRAFEIGIRASDSGQAFDDESLKRIVDPVLSAGVLPVPSAQILSRSGTGGCGSIRRRSRVSALASRCPVVTTLQQIKPTSARC